MKSSAPDQKPDRQELDLVDFAGLPTGHQYIKVQHEKQIATKVEKRDTT